MKCKRGMRLIGGVMGCVGLIFIGLRIFSTMRQKQIRVQVLGLIERAGGYEAVYKDCNYLFEAVRLKQDAVFPNAREIPSLSKIGYGVLGSPTLRDGLLITTPLGRETGGGQLYVYKDLNPEKAPEYLIHITNNIYFNPTRRAVNGP